MTMTLRTARASDREAVIDLIQVLNAFEADLPAGAASPFPG